MVLKNAYSAFFWIGIFIFCTWLVNKSFGYNAQTGYFYVARHQVGDFGLHLSLVRSVSYGNNVQLESPFYPGGRLPYHYGFDWIVGQLEARGVPLVIAVNGLSVLAFFALLYGIYCLSQVIFEKSRLLGVLSVLLFLFHSDFSFVGYFLGRQLDGNFLYNLWRVQDYPFKGPFDGSEISLLFSLNTLLNQRHLIAGMAIGVWVIYGLLSSRLFSAFGRQICIALLAIIVGFLFQIHSLISVSTAGFIMMLLLVSRQVKEFIIFGVIIAAIMLPRLVLISSGEDRIFFFIQPYLGFFTQQPVTVWSFFRYWFLNMGMLPAFMVLSYIWSRRSQRVVFIISGMLFLVANLFQLSFRLEHNQSVINYFFLFASIFVAYAITRIIQRIRYGVVLGLLSLCILMFSGVLSLLVIKNDFRYPVPDFAGNGFMRWIRDHTERQSIFLEKPDFYSPVTLSGRFTYIGPDYYLIVMGYDTAKRRASAQAYFEASETSILARIRDSHISYMVFEKAQSANFPYHINWDFWEENTRRVFENEMIRVYKI